MINERIITVPNDDDGQRLDRWLKRHAPDIPYGLAQKLIRKGAIRIDGKKAKTDTRLSGGQDVRVPAVEAQHRPYNDKKEDVLSDQDIAFMKSLVIYQDEDIIAINKPHGLAVQGGSKTTRHIDGMLDALTNKEGVRPRLVHRLDKDTSGVLLLARSSKVAKALGSHFKRQIIRKIYWAIVSPTPADHRGAIKAPLAKAGGLNRERMVVDEEEGKYALTEYEVIEHAHKQAAFVAFWPKTGRTHQIRVHAELMGCPILGDNKYRGALPENGEEHIKPITEGGVKYAKRLHLHAHSLSFPHPTRRGTVEITAPLPDELRTSWKSLGFSSSFKGTVFDGME